MNPMAVIPTKVKDRILPTNVRHYFTKQHEYMRKYSKDTALLPHSLVCILTKKPLL